MRFSSIFVVCALTHLIFGQLIHDPLKRVEPQLGTKVNIKWEDKGSLTQEQLKRVNLDLELDNFVEISTADKYKQIMGEDAPAESFKNGFFIVIPGAPADLPTFKPVTDFAAIPRTGTDIISINTIRNREGKQLVLNINTQSRETDITTGANRLIYIPLKRDKIDSIQINQPIQ